MQFLTANTESNSGASRFQSFTWDPICTPGKPGKRHTRVNRKHDATTAKVERNIQWKTLQNTEQMEHEIL